MKLYVTALVAMLLLSVAIYTRPGNQQSKLGSQQTIQVSDIQVSKRLKGQVTAAKNEGKNSITITTPQTIEYAGVEDDIAKTLSYYDFVVAELVEQRSYLSAENDITTWAKFRIVDTLSRGTEKLNFKFDPPVGMLPPDQNEFLIEKAGGSALIDGVRVNVLDPTFPAFQKNKKYLLLVSLEPSRIGVLAGGPAGVFTTDESGLLTPLKKGPNRLSQNIQDNLGRSTIELRNKISTMRPQ